MGHRWSFMIGSLVALCGALGPVLLKAQPSAEPILKLELGIGGQSRLGQWTPFVCEVSEALANGLAKARVTCQDVDDQPAGYELPLYRHPQQERLYLGHFILGRTYGRLKLQLLNQQDQVLAEQTLNVRPDGATWRIVPATTKLIAFVGLAPTARSLLPSSAALRSGTEATSLLEVPDIRSFPWQARGLQTLDTLVLSANNHLDLEQLTPAHVQAIEEWVRAGGKLILWTGSQADQTAGGRDLIARLVPGQWQGGTLLQTSGKLEIQVNAKVTLINSTRPNVPAIRLVPQGAVVALQQDDLPLVVRRAHGFGSLTFVALPLDSDEFVSWPGTSNLLDQLIAGTRWTEERSMAETFSSRVTHYGYRDVAGQLKGALDQFSRVTVISFSSIALLIGLFILLVGPVDYFIVKKWFKRPEWTWATFLMWVALFSVAAVFLSRAAKPDSLQVRSLEIIDWDARDGSLRGSLWAGMYSPHASLSDIRLQVETGLVESVTHAEVRLMGQPGTGLGGTESGMGIGWQNLPYRQTESSGPGAAEQLELQQLPIPVAASRSFNGEWRGSTALPVRSRLRFNRRTGRLTGNFVNPLDVPLRDVRILYENWGYVFEGSLGPGESIDLVEARERTAKAILTLRGLRSDDPTQSEPWNVADTDIRRIAHLMMFYQAAGGQAYATLTHAYWNRIDFSDILHTGCAVLTAELPDGVARLVLDGRAVDASQQEQTVMLRIVLPVEMEAR